MPTYEYKCDNCGYRFDKFQNMNDKPLKQCPRCSGTLRKLFSAGAGIIFKGSGFHSNDYRVQNGMNDKTRCGKDQTCCGRDVPCDKPPCEK